MTDEPKQPASFPELTDHRFEDPESLSRRGFLKQGIAAVTAGSLVTTTATAAVNLVPENTNPGPKNEKYWQQVADQFLLRPGLTYLNTGTRGPSPAPVYQAQVTSIQRVNEDRLGYVQNTYTSEYKASVRTKLASFLGCKVNEVAITNNTTEGMAIGTNGPDLKRGDEIIYTNHDHASGGQPINLRCARQGTVARMVDLSDRKFHPARSPDDIVQAIEAEITPRTKLISICHVNYTDGCVMPVREICELARSKNILTLVDGAHPPGMLDMNLEELGCDMYAGACHKWMLAGMLTGFLYVREELQEQIWPSIYSGPVLGKNMYGAPDDREKGRTAERYETHGSVNYASLVSIDAALDFHNAIGSAAIEARDRYMAEQARLALAAMPGVDLFVSEDPRLCAGLVSFKIRHVPAKALSKMLWENHNIYIREVVHEEINWEANRLSLHIMATMPQVARTLGAIEEIARSA